MNIALICVWIVGVFYAYGDWFQLLGGRRTQAAIGWIALGATYVAFRYEPEASAEAIMRQVRPIVDRFMESWSDSFKPNDVPVTTPSTLP